MKLYGITNCDSVKKQRKQWDNNNIDYDFIDLKQITLSERTIAKWLATCPNTLVNKRSTTYRKIKTQWLTAADKPDEKIALIQANPTLIKRPLIEHDNGDITVGLRPSQ